MPTLRTATRADIDAMWALRTRAILHGCHGHYPHDVIEPWSAAPLPRSYPSLVDAGGAVIAQEQELEQEQEREQEQEQVALLGYAIVDVATGEVDAVFVDPHAGGRGIGKTMLAALERMALAHGHTRLYLSASLNAVPFYQEAGFVVLRNAAYPHPCGIALACVEMEKPLLISRP